MSKSLHRQLCEIGAKFLKRSASKNGHGCHFAIIEPSVYGENPDVFGVRHGTISKHKIGDTVHVYGYDVGTVVLEAKTSRPDFLRDRAKSHKATDEMGLGRWRYYICPENLIKVEDLPPKYGLIWVTKGGQVKVIAGALAVKKRTVKDYAGRERKFRNMLDVQESFAAWSFDDRNHQNEMNLMAMALARLEGAEDILYLQREKIAIENKLANRVLELERKLREAQSQLCSYTAQETLDKFIADKGIPRTPRLKSEGTTNE